MLASGEFQAGDRDAAQWLSIFNPKTLSSEESDIEDNEEVLIVHPIPWLTEAVVNLKAIIDRQITAKKTPQARRPTKKRLIRRDSTRSPQKELPTWALKNLY